MKIFSFNENAKSYKYPIIKIFVCILIIFAAIYREHIIHIDNKIVNVIISILFVQIGILSVLCIYISVCELTVVRENRAKGKTLSQETIENSKPYTIFEIVSMIEKEDIICIKIVSKNQKSIEIGASSDCKNGSSEFFDKMYYIEKREFKDIELFKLELLECATDGKISVISIDDVKV